MIGTVGENHSGLGVVVKERKHALGERGVEVGAPEGAAVARVFDNATELQTKGESSPSCSAIGRARRYLLPVHKTGRTPASAARATAASVRGRSLLSGSSSVPSTSKARIR